MGKIMKTSVSSTLKRLRYKLNGVFFCVILGLSFITIFSCKSSDDSEMIALIAKLPDNDKYLINGKFVDIGIFYKQSDWTGIPYAKQWCLFNGNTYWKMDKAELDEIAKEEGIILQSDMTLPFWNEWGVRINGIIFILVMIILFVLWLYRPKTKIIKPLNKSLNKANAAKLIFSQHYKIKKFNGIDVNWAVNIALSASILLPPGNCSLFFNYKEKKNKREGTANGIIEAGKTYLLKSTVLPISIVTNIVESNEDELKKYLDIEAKVGNIAKKILDILEKIFG